VKRDVMAIRVEPGIGKARALSCAAKRATVMGSRSAYFIRASGQRVPRQQAGYMTAPDHNANTIIIILATQGPSIHDSALNSWRAMPDSERN